jgi:hypothetical protein
MREIVVAICATVVFALFLYVFNDFLNVEISQVSVAMRDVFGRWLGRTILLLSAGFSGRSLMLKARDTNSLGNFALSMGENPKTVNFLSYMEGISTLCLFYVPSLVLVQTFFMAMSPRDLAIILPLMIFGSWSVKTFGRHRRDGRLDPKSVKPDLLPPAIKLKSRAMVLWRTGQILRRNRLTQVCVLFALAFSALLAFVSYKHGPLFAAILTSFMSGLLMASALAFQIAEDTGYSWIEKSLGVSHDDYVLALKSAALRLAFPLGLLNGLIWFLGLWNNHGLGVFQELTSFSDAAKILSMTVIPAWIAPFLAFQIDARRPFIQITVILLLGLFLCTAVFNHWLGLLLLPLFSYYAGQTQNGHFYRS